MATITPTTALSNSSPSDDIIARSYTLNSPAEAAALYDDWAAQYDEHMIAQDYVAPQLVAQAAAKLVANHLDSVKFLDAGCGTGLVGVALAKLGARHIDGVDYSAGMLDIARKAGVFEKLQRVDLSMKPLPGLPDDEYDVVACSGTLTRAHVGPGVLEEFVRITKPNGYVVATVHEAVWEKAGFRAEVERLVEVGQVELRSAEGMEYRRSVGVGAKLLVLLVLG